VSLETKETLAKGERPDWGRKDEGPTGQRAQQDQKKPYFFPKIVNISLGVKEKRMFKVGLVCEWNYFYSASFY
jgi:hypothetical protein